VIWSAIVHCSSSSWCLQQCIPGGCAPVLKHSVMDSKVDVAVAAVGGG
jgi:hypothetical protein